MNADSRTTPPNLADLIDRVEARLRHAPLSYGHGTDNPRDEAAWLVLTALDLSPVEAVDPERPVSAAESEAVDQLARRRIKERQPLAYLTGRAWFAGLEFLLRPGVLVPRSPLAEPIGERFQPWLADRPVERILDIGTGSGCIAIACALAFPEAVVDATDIDPVALALAQENVGRFGLNERVELHRADVYDRLPPDRRYDLIVSNPPYVDAAAMASLPAEYRHEPSAALAAGADGLEIIARILAGAGERLREDGLLVVEAGSGGPLLEQRYPSTPFVWLSFESADVDVFVLPAADLPAV